MKEKKLFFSLCVCQFLPIHERAPFQNNLIAIRFAHCSQNDSEWFTVCQRMSVRSGSLCRQTHAETLKLYSLHTTNPSLILECFSAQRVRSSAEVEPFLQRLHSAAAAAAGINKFNCQPGIFYCNMTGPCVI